MSDTRIERDSMGELRVPQEALYGAQTQRAVNNFPISHQPMPAQFIRAADASTGAIRPGDAAFWLQVIEQQTELAGDSYRLIVAIEDSCEVSVGEQTVTARQGQAVAITPEERTARISTSGRAIAAVAA